MMNDITLYGFVRVYPEIFEDLDLPEGLDPEMVKFTILDNAGMMFPYHQVMPQLSIAVHYWFAQNKNNFARIMRAMAEDYSPIENYDRMEDRTIQSKNTNESAAHSNSTSNSNSTTTNGRAADNSETFRNVDQSVGSASAGDTSNSNVNGTTTGDVLETSRIHGNIGVMTAGTMITEEINLRRYNIYEDICNRFVDKFLLGVYD